MKNHEAEKNIMGERGEEADMRRLFQTIISQYYHAWDMYGRANYLLTLYGSMRKHSSMVYTITNSN